VLSAVVAIVGIPMVAFLARAARRVAAADRARGLAPRPGWRLPTRARVGLVRALHDADLDVEPEHALELWAIGVVGAAVVSGALAPGMAVPAVLAGMVGAPVALRVARGRRERRFAAALPAALEHVSAELRGGGTVAVAIEHLADARGAAAADLRRVRTRTRLGLPLADALARWPAEHDSDAVRAVAGALAVAATMGGGAAGAIDGLAASLRHRLDAVAEARALSSQARLSAVVVGAAPLGYLAFSGLVDRRSVTVLVSTAIGRLCLVLGLGLEALAAWWIRRIVGSQP